MNSMNDKSKHKLTIFHCINTFAAGESLSLAIPERVELEFVSLPCSSMVKDIYLLRAFEAGADAVAVLVCPDGACRYVEGNLRAKKRVRWVCDLLDEIEIDGRRLSLFNIASEDAPAVNNALGEMLSRLAELGTNPAER